MEDGTVYDKVLDTYTLKDIFYVDGKFVYSPDIKLPNNYGDHYKGKHQLIILKKEFLPKNTTTPLYLSSWTNTMLSGYSDVIEKRIDKMINLIQHLLQDEPNRRDESNREFIERFFEKRTDYTKEQYEIEKAQFKEDMEKTLEELKDRDIKYLLTGIHETETETETKTETKTEPASAPHRRLYYFFTRKNLKSKSKSNTVKRRKLYIQPQRRNPKQFYPLNRNIQSQRRNPKQIYPSYRRTRKNKRYNN